MTITEFLLARIAEDEALPLTLESPSFTGDRVRDYHRWIRECDAKRAIVDAYAKEQWVISQGHNSAYTTGGQDAREPILGWLAAVYSDHPDYQQEWAL